MNKLIAAIALSSPLLALALPATNLVSNGSFESQAVSSDTFVIVSNTAGWIGGTNGIELRNNKVGTASDGLNFVELDTTGNSSMSQSLSTVAGQWYTLSFDYSNRIDVAPNSNGLSWTFGSTSGVAAAQSQISGNHVWQHFSTQVLASSSLTTLSFAAMGISDTYGTSLDNVSVTAVTAVPEPQSYALLLAGLGAIAFVVRRRMPAIIR